ncbi:MAG: 50S ribosomal protein L18e [Candidatus Pacearchaeota archaeon]|jgi:large subunit ribosomal protein L18e
MKTKTKIGKQLLKKTNPELVETIKLAKKNDKWLEVASLLSYPRKKRINLNLEEIDKNSKEGETILVPGKVLSNGEISKKLKVIALSFSDVAKEKLKNQKCEVVIIGEEIKKNPEMKGVKILR